MEPTADERTVYKADGKPVEAVRIEDVTLALKQAWSLSSVTDPIALEDIPVQTFKLWSLRESPSSSRNAYLSEERLTLQPSQPWSIEQTVLLPDDPAIASSVSPLSKTGLRPNHRLQMTVTYAPILREAGRSASRVRGQMDEDLAETRLVAGLKKEIVVSTPVTLSNCACVAYALTLPAYGQAEYEDLLRHQKACDQRSRSRKRPIQLSGNLADLVILTSLQSLKVKAILPTIPTTSYNVLFSLDSPQSKIYFPAS